MIDYVILYCRRLATSSPALKNAGNFSNRRLCCSGTKGCINQGTPAMNEVNLRHPQGLHPKSPRCFRNVCRRSNNLGSQFKNGKSVYNSFNITKDFQSINNKGQTVKNLFFLGLPTEGIKFYTFILPRPFIKSTFLADSSIAVQSLLNNITTENK